MKIVKLLNSLQTNSSKKIIKQILNIDIILHQSRTIMKNHKHNVAKSNTILNSCRTSLGGLNKKLNKFNVFTKSFKTNIEIAYNNSRKLLKQKILK